MSCSTCKSPASIWSPKVGTKRLSRSAVLYLHGLFPTLLNTNSQVLEHIARKNGKTITLTLESPRAVAKDKTSQTGTIIHLSTYRVVRNAFSSFSLFVLYCFFVVFLLLTSVADRAHRSHVTPLFSTRRLAINTSITIVLWGSV
jgi:hypothetical protein